MRTLGDDYRLQALSVAEIRESLDELVLRYARRHKFQGRQLKLGPLINAIVFRFLEMSEGEREAFAVEGLRGLERMLAGEPAPDVQGEAEIPNVGSRVAVPRSTSDASKPRKRRSG